MPYLIVILCSYLLGTLNLAFFLARSRGTDLRSGGSGNLGASNATVVLGWKAGIAVAIHDIGKAALAVWLAGKLFPQLPYIGVIAGISSVLGHIFPFYLHFKGGKGFASYLGMTLMLNWKLAAAVILLAVLITVITDYIALGTISTVLVVPAYLIYLLQSWIPALVLFSCTIIIVLKHRDNIRRILSGTEIGLRSTIKGEHRAA